MAVLVGEKALLSAFLGDKEIREIWVGSSKVYEKTNEEPNDED